MHRTTEINFSGIPQNTEEGAEVKHHLTFSNFILLESF